MIQKIFALLACLTFLTSGDGLAQTDPGLEKTGEQAIDPDLNELRDRMANAFAARDVESILKDLGPDVVFTWQNGTRTAGLKEFQTFFNEMMVGDRSIVMDLKTTRQSEARPIMYDGSTAVAWGSTKDEFKLRDGDEFALQSKWTATLVKSDERWRVVSYHVSTDAFNNPMLTVAKQNLITFATIGTVLGFALGIALTWFVMHSTRRLADQL